MAIHREIILNKEKERELEKLKEPETKTRVMRYRIDYSCPDCKGPVHRIPFMEPEDNKFEHRCEKCGWTKYLPRTYPYFIEEDEKKTKEFSVLTG